MGVPVIRMRFVPSGNTLTPSAMRCSSSSASSLAFCAQRAGVVEEGDLSHEQAIFTRNGNAVFSFRGIEDAGERTTHSWSWVSRSMPRLCHISRLSAMFDSSFVRRRHPAPGAMRACALRARFPITITRRIASPQGIRVQKRNVERRCRMADALQVRERCLAFEAYGACASGAE